MATLKEVESEAGFDQLIKNASPSTLFVLYFHTPWAAPCAQMNTILTTLASTYPADADVSFLSINAEDLADISESYDVTAVPFLVLQKGGETLQTVSGIDPAKVRAAVEKYAGAGTAAGKNGIPPPLQATPLQQQPQTNGAGATKDLSSYAPKDSDNQTAPAYSSNQESQAELNDRLGKLVKAAAPQCGFSRQLVSILRENQVKYGFFNILADNDVREGLKVFSDWPTFPQLYTNGELVGGLDIVREELEADPDFFKPFSAAQPAPV